MTVPTIDMTDRFYADRYAQGGIGEWTLDRQANPCHAIALHHAAGWYGQPLGPDANEDQERAQIESMAQDHAARDTIGIGPAYNYVAFPSGRLYAVGKVGTQRAHTKGRNPETGKRWNVEALAVCAMGNLEDEQPTAALKQAIGAAVDEIRGFSFSDGAMPVHGHGLIPTVTSSGVAYPQGTVCPGRYLLPFVAELNAGIDPRPPPPVEPTPIIPDVSVELAAIRAAADEIEAKIA
jgi:hypothetical protein